MKKSNVKTDKNGNIEKITLKLNNNNRCIRCGAKKDSEQYIGCFDEYCDTDTLIDYLF